MFTGIVEELGTVAARDGGRFRFECRTVLDDAELGASIAVNGCCLTVVDFDAGAGWWEADGSARPSSRTNLGDLAPGDRVNLERPVRLADRLGGHLVQGHVDGVGTIARAGARPGGARTRRPRRATWSRRVDHRRRREPDRRRGRRRRRSPSPSSRTPPRSPRSATRVRATGSTSRST